MEKNSADCLFIIISIINNMIIYAFVCLKVTALAIIHFILSVGNITTTLKVVQGKIQGEMRSRSLTSKYKFNNGVAK